MRRVLAGRLIHIQCRFLTATKPRDICWSMLSKRPLAGWDLPSNIRRQCNVDVERFTGDAVNGRGRNPFHAWKLNRVCCAGSRQIVGNAKGTTLFFFLTAGEDEWKLSAGALSIDRHCHLPYRSADMPEAGAVGACLPRPSRRRTDMFQGATDERGMLTLRWEGEEQQNVTLSLEGSTMRRIFVRAHSGSL